MNSALSATAMPGSPERKRESLDAQKVLRMLAKALAPLGFTRTKPSFFTRGSDLVVEFVHIHKYTFGPTFRIHFGVRVLNDAWPNVALNGPCVDGILNSESSRYTARFEFAPDSTSMAECAQLMANVIRLQGEPWFTAMRPLEELLDSPESPLRTDGKAALRAAMTGAFDPAAIAKSRSSLGLA